MYPRVVAVGDPGSALHIGDDTARLLANSLLMTCLFQLSLLIKTWQNGYGDVPQGAVS